MNISFFTDTHIGKQVAIQLRVKGITVVRCQDVGLEDAEDAKLLEYAISHEFSLLTKDDDFLKLHREYINSGNVHFGIFYCPYRDIPSIGLIVKVCSEYHELIESGAGTVYDIKNQVIFIS